MEKLKMALLCFGLTLFLLGGMMALPGQEALTALVVAMGCVCIISIGMVEYIEDRRR